MTAAQSPMPRRATATYAHAAAPLAHVLALIVADARIDRREVETTEAREVADFCRRNVDPADLTD